MTRTRHTALSGLLDSSLTRSQGSASAHLRCVSLHPGLRVLRAFGTGLTLFIALLVAGTSAHASGTDSTAIALALVEPFGIESANGDKPSIALTKISDLKFGGIIPTGTPGTLTMSPAGVLTATGGVYIYRTGFTTSAASFLMTLYNTKHRTNDDREQSDDNEGYRNEDDDQRSNDTRNTFGRHGLTVGISMSSSCTLRQSGGTATMTADNFKFTRTLGTIKVGATLHVAAHQAGGSYTGTFTVTTILD